MKIKKLFKILSLALFLGTVAPGFSQERQHSEQHNKQEATVEVADELLIMKQNVDLFIDQTKNSLEMSAESIEALEDSNDSRTWEAFMELNTSLFMLEQITENNKAIQLPGKTKKRFASLTKNTLKWRTQIKDSTPTGNARAAVHDTQKVLSSLSQILNLLSGKSKEKKKD